MDVDRRSLLAAPLAALPQGGGGGENNNLDVSTPNVMTFGAKGDGKVDDTQAMMRAHRDGQMVYYPPGRYRFSRLVFDRGGIVGAGQATRLMPYGNDARPRIHYVGDSGNNGNAPRFLDFLLDGHDTSGSATAIKLTSGSDAPAQSDARVDGVTMLGWGTCLDTTGASGWRVTNCSFYGYSAAGIVVGNPLRPDVGDNQISGCQFLTNGRFVSAAAVRQSSGGGLRIIANKFNGGGSAYFLDLSGTTSITVFTGNSVENFSGTALVFCNDSNARTHPVRFDQIVISGNQFANNAGHIAFRAIADHAGSSYWDIVNITCNTFKSAASQEAVSIATARLVAVTGNVFWGGDIAIKVTGPCDPIKIDNLYTGLATPVLRD